MLDRPTFKSFEVIRIASGELGRTPQRSHEIFLIRAKILQPYLAHEWDQLGSHGTFARPQSTRCTPKHPRVLLHREEQMRLRVFRPPTASLPPV